MTKLIRDPNAEKPVVTLTVNSNLSKSTDCYNNAALTHFVKEFNVKLCLDLVVFIFARPKGRVKMEARVGIEPGFAGTPSQPVHTDHESEACR